MPKTDAEYNHMYTVITEVMYEAPAHMHDQWETLMNQYNAPPGLPIVDVR